MPPTITRDDFARALARKLRAPYFIPQRRALLTWMQCEGDAARYNPLGTTLPLSSLTAPSGVASTRFNEIGVQNYSSFEDGVFATAKTLNDGANRAGDPLHYKPIRRRLRLTVPAYWVVAAIGLSKWGTNAQLLLDVLKDAKRDIDPLANHLIVQFLNEGVN